MQLEPHYPEHEKLESVKGRSQIIGEFLETSRYQLCEYHQGLLEGGEGQSGFMPTRGTIEQILAEHFGIDLEVLEREKRQMLDVLGTS